ncbi:MAG: AarF/ABC1/UbiB kinase family protein, partial [Methanobacteriota archaeon]
ELIIPRYQPREILKEFGRYTLKEIDLTYEADHAELFAANFADYPDIVFPKIYRELSSRDVLCMDYLEGIQPNNPKILELSTSDIQKVIDLGAGAIIKMLYEDGFFHADLHAANIVVLPGPKLGFMDLGMVGRFDEKMKRAMLYYFYAMVNGDVEGAIRYLMSIAKFAKGGDPHGFRRDVEELARRYLLVAPHGNFSLAQLIMESVRIGSRHHVSFPVEMTLMVKALVTFEGVGLYLDPRLDVPGLSRKHIMRIFRRHFSVEKLSRQLLRGLPELLDLAVSLPEIITTSSRFWQDTINEKPQPNPFEGLRSALIAGACILGGVVTIVQGGPEFLWIVLFIMGGGLWLFGK